MVVSIFTLYAVLFTINICPPYIRDQSLDLNLVSLDHLLRFLREPMLQDHGYHNPLASLLSLFLGDNSI